ncbi:MAG: hypothetical protein ABIZ05_14770 [Pseudonocardiaceae bacterium]
MSARHPVGVDAPPLAPVMTPALTSVLTRVLALVLIGLGSVGIGWLLWPQAGGGVVRAASATVVQSVLCSSSEARDVVRVELPEAPQAAREVLARLDGCGHRWGEVLSVELPDPLPEGELLARLSGTGVPAATTDGRRLVAVGVAVASLAGALLAWRLRGGWGAARR